MRRLLFLIGLTLAVVATAPEAIRAADRALPHGGYDAATDDCLQCHDVRAAGNDYVLLQWQTITAACGSCHYLYVGRYPRGAGSLSTTNSLGSRTSAYETDYGSKFGAYGHNLGRGAGLQAFADGLDKTSDHIPGGFDILSAVEQGAYPDAVNALNYSGANGLDCSSCHTPHGNFNQQSSGAPTGAWGGKLLSAKPNHAVSDLPIGVGDAGGDGWCIACHARRAEGAVDPATGEVYHNHPNVACLTCHSNGTGGSNTDFPHTGDNPDLLPVEADALCLNCHKAGNYP